MSVFQYLANHFRPKKVGEKQYIDHVPFIRRFKTQKGKSKTTIKQFVEVNKLEYTITDLDGNIVDDTIDQYHYKRNKILISIDSMVSAEQLMPLIIQAHTEALNNTLVKQEVVAHLPNEQTDSNTDMSETKVVPASAPTINSNQFDLLELADDEMFRDMNDNPVEIEVRGVRTEAGILFRAKHISKYLGMVRLLDTLQDPRYSYKKDIHWIKLYQYSDRIVMASLFRDARDNEATAVSSENVTDSLISNSLANEANDTLEKPIWGKIYLTLAGLLKVIFCSTSANENVIILRNRVINLVFVHKFGSATERMDLVESLAPYKKCLNKLSGIYLIRIGKVKDLRDAMSISKDLYPSSKFDTANVFKFGRSDDIMLRFKQHCERTGYGKYSNTISMEWFVVVPPQLCSNAESELNKYFETHQFKFAFSDGTKDHTELIIVKPGIEKQHTKDKYFELVKNFPGEANAIIKQMTELKLERDQTIDRMLAQHENELLKVRYDSDKKDLTHKLELLREQSDKKDLVHQVELLQLKLELASLK